MTKKRRALVEERSAAACYSPCARLGRIAAGQLIQIVWFRILIEAGWFLYFGHKNGLSWY